MVKLQFSSCLLLAGVFTSAVTAVGLPFAASAGISSRDADTFVNQETCNGKTFTYRELAGYGYVPSNFRDKYGDTLSFGSAVALEPGSWKKKGRMRCCRGGEKVTYYEGTLWMLPDRGWNTEGTTAYQPRVHKFKIILTPAVDATPESPSPPNIEFKYLDTVLFTDPTGNPISGLDATTVLKFGGKFPDIPAAAFPGDGFGGEGPGGVRVSMDPEGLVLGDKGAFWISDEYGPYIYRFDRKGKMTLAIRPPDAYIPIRNGAQSFASNNPPIYDPGQVVIPGDPTMGRANNQGFEGLTVSADGKNLYALMQSALIQDGGREKYTNRYSRMLRYDIGDGNARLVREWVVPLPQYVDPSKPPSKNPRTAAQSEIFALGDKQFFILSRDSGFGRLQSNSKSIYRHLDVFDLTSATNILPQNLTTITTSPSSGVLLPSINPALYCPFVNINDNTQLARFSLHNGGPQDAGLLNEKWEGIAIMPVDGEEGDDGEWFVLVVSDNDFVTQDGWINGGRLPYADASGGELLNQALMLRVELPKRSTPWGK